MTYLASILAVEEQAKVLIEKAEAEAVKRVNDARATALARDAECRVALQRERESALDAQKNELALLREKMIEQAKKGAEQLLSVAKSRQSKAVETIIGFVAKA